MGWEKWFPGYEVPKKIEELVERGFLWDDTWENDYTPVFKSRFADGSYVHLFVDHQDKSERFLGPRYEVQIMEPYSIGVTVMETDRLADAIEALRAVFKKKMKALS